MNRENLIKNLEKVAAAQEEIEEACAAFGIDAAELEMDEFVDECKKLSTEKIDYILSLFERIDNELSFVEEEKNFKELIVRLQEIKAID